MKNRRQFLQLGGGAALAALAGPAVAAEGRGKWDEQSIAEYTQKLFDWLTANFDQRARTLANETGEDLGLGYDYLAPVKDKARSRVFEKFKEGRLAEGAAEKHIESCLAEFERVRQTLAAAEAKAAEAWKAGENDVAAKEGKIYDSTVTAARLTVVLDNSRSMAPYLAKLREEIHRDFTNAYFVEVNGCDMSQMANCPWFYSAPSIGTNPFTPDRHIPKVPTLADRPHSAFIGWTRDAPAALECMFDLMRTDAIYWFCDFDDPTSESVIKNLARKVIEQKAKFYVHTLGKKAPALVATLAEMSGGQVVRKRI